MKPLDRAKEYQRNRQRLTLFHLAFTPLVILASLVTPLSIGLEETARSLAPQPFLALALYFVFFSIYMTVADFPFAIYSGFFLEHRFGLSNQRLPGWLLEFLKKALLSLALALVLIEGLYALIWNYPETWWFFAWIGYSVFSYGLGKLFPVLIVPLFYRYGPLEDIALKERILALVRRWGLPVENVYSLNLSKTTKKANAAFMGLGRTKRVVLSDTLIANFTPEEIETVVAHELGHFKHRDIWKQLAFGLTASFFGFWTAFHLAQDWAADWGMGGVEQIASLPLLLLVFYLFSLVLTPLGSAFSRMLERAADRFALKAAGPPGTFISCMEKLGGINLADPDPNPVYEWFFYDHPAIGKRIRMAREWKG